MSTFALGIESDGEGSHPTARRLRARATDGFNISPYIVSGGLVPELQERGGYRTEYTSTTLRGHLGLREPLTRRQNAETGRSTTG